MKAAAEVCLRHDWTQADAYLFDIDGTLLNVRDAVHYFAFSHAVRTIFGLEATIDGVLVHGSTDVGILRAVMRRAGVPAAEWEPRLPEMLAAMAEEVERNHGQMRAEPCPAIHDLVEELARRGKLLGVASGNIERIGWIKVAKAGLRDYFQFGSFCDERESRAEIFRHGLEQVHDRLGPGATVWVIGDTPSDITAAKVVGAPIVALATGTYSIEQLQAEQPDVCVSCSDRLIEQLRRFPDQPELG